MRCLLPRGSRRSAQHAAAVGKGLGLTVFKPTVVTYAKRLALECKYVNKRFKTTLSHSSDTRSAFLAEETATSIRVVPKLGKGVVAYLLLPVVLYVQKGTVECTIETEVGATQEKALAEVLLKSYW